MAERKAWTQEEDEALKYLYEVQQIRSWASISQALKSRFGIQFRNGKQCRQRYYNHLDQDISKKCWTFKEDKLLLQLHHRYGNSWTKISQELSGRSDNCIKNHFYSQLRKGLKMVNNHIKNLQQLKIEPFKLSFMMKLFKIAEIKKIGRKKLPVLSIKCREIRDKIMSYVLRSEYFADNQPIYAQIQQLTLNIDAIKQSVTKFKNNQGEEQIKQYEQTSYTSINHCEIIPQKYQQTNNEICTSSSLGEPESIILQLQDLTVEIDQTSVSENWNSDYQYKIYEDISVDCNILEVQYFDTLKFLSELQ